MARMSRHAHSRSLLRHQSPYTCGIIILTFLTRPRGAPLLERRFTRQASSIRSTARRSARPRPMTTSGSGPIRSVHCGGTDHTVATSSCSKRRLPYRLCRLPTHGSSRPNNGWNGCVTRTNCGDGLEESAFSVEIQAVGARAICLAADARGGCDADAGAIVDAVRGHRLACTGPHRYSDTRRLMR